MRVKLHLVSMPWADPELPSIQIAALKAHMDRALGDTLQTTTYSAFAAISLERREGGWVNGAERFEDHEEYPYFLLCLKRFAPPQMRHRSSSLARLLSTINRYEVSHPLTAAALLKLEERTRHYVQRYISPETLSDGVNVVGFTLNYYQLYASIYVARYLAAILPARRFLFVFGGATVVYPKVAEALRRFGINGYCVIGEGERKLELMLRSILAATDGATSALSSGIAAIHPSIYDIQSNVMDLYRPDVRKLLEMQLPMTDLPLPDMDEYYATVDRTLGGGAVARAFRATTWTTLEGSRGCFAHCDFCDVHTSWSGFRKTSGNAVADRTLQLVRRHGSPRIKFMDNVCDTWASSYSETLIDKKVRIAAFMECRVHHPEIFWTRLSLSGVCAVQVGIEAYSSALLKAMNKGTSAHQNLLVQKWLKELGIDSLSNLIGHHPKSTLDDVAETRRILEATPHLDRLSFSPLGLLLGSPLDQLLDDDARRTLVERQLFALPKALDRLFVLKGEYVPPSEWLDPAVKKGWDKLIRWENDFAAKRRPAQMTCQRIGERHLLVVDGRSRLRQQHLLADEYARVYEQCHQGRTLAALEAGSNVSPSIVGRVVDSLLDRKLAIASGQHIVSLALRPRDELVQAYFASRRSEGRLESRVQFDSGLDERSPAQTGSASA